MKILVISQHYYPENFRITDICETLVKLGHHVEVICGMPNYPEGKIYDGYSLKNNKEEQINGVIIHRCFEIPRGHNKIKLFLNYYSVCLSMKKRALKLKDKFDVVFINETSPVMVAWAGIAYAKKWKVKSVLYCYDLWPDSLSAGGIKENSLIYKYYLKISKKCYEGVDKLLITSKLFKEYLKSKFDVKNVNYLPQYCEDIFENGINTNEKMKDTIDYVFAGNIGKMQSVETIIKASKLIKNPNIKIHIIGDGSNLETCKEMAEKQDNIIFYGKKSLKEMPYYYNLADALIVTLKDNETISRTLPGKVQSYMSFGKPIIGAINGECKNIIEESKCGLCCNAEKYEDLAKIFEQMSKMDLSSLGENAKRYYNENFNKKLFFDRLLNEMRF